MTHPERMLDWLADGGGPGADPALEGVGVEELQSWVRKVHHELSETWGDPQTPHRWQDAVIEEHVPAEATVLDLGCGHGDLLRRLICDKQVRAQGIEVAHDAVLTCLRRCIPVIQADIDGGLRGLEDGSIDYVILEETLQALRRPREILREMLRVGRTGVVSFPNFGCWSVRVRLALTGRMPVTRELPYEWYDTPNIHLLTLADFASWAEADGAVIVDGYAYADGEVRPLALPEDNIRSEQVLLFVERGGGTSRL